MGKISESILNKIVDEILSVATCYTKEELNELINQNRQQRILLHCIIRFANSELFRINYKDAEYYDDQDSILSISTDKITLSLAPHIIKDNLSKVLNKCFITDNKDRYDKIVEYISHEYIYQSKATVQLYDVLKSQQDNFDSMGENISEVKKLIIQDQEKQKRLFAKKQDLLKYELQNIVQGNLVNMMKYFLIFVCKQSPSIIGPNGEGFISIPESMSVKIAEIISDLDVYITDDFGNIPIKVNLVNTSIANFSDCCIEQEVNYFMFLDIFKGEISKSIDDLRKYEDYIDIDTRTLVLRLKNYINAPIFTSVPVSVKYYLESNNQNIKVNKNDMQKIIKSMGQCLIDIKKELTQ
ncbi:hypothetical protein [Anaerocolumna sp.]|uniref:hypothetical protein n=1 Tax=Anaerocolumna sp. TaxID=2041569 RepID=UPI0028ADB407|nr:hypothetical protein [Anaerocolumna sp.]